MDVQNGTCRECGAGTDLQNDGVGNALLLMEDIAVAAMELVELCSELATVIGEGPADGRALREATVRQVMAGVQMIGWRADLGAAELGGETVRGDALSWMAPRGYVAPPTEGKAA